MTGQLSVDGGEIDNDLGIGGGFKPSNNGNNPGENNFGGLNGNNGGNRPGSGNNGGNRPSSNGGGSSGLFDNNSGNSNILTGNVVVDGQGGSSANNNGQGGGVVASENVGQTQTGSTGTVINGGSTNNNGIYLKVTSLLKAVPDQLYILLVN